MEDFTEAAGSRDWSCVPGFLGRVAVSPQERMGSRPVSLTSMLSWVREAIFFRTFAIFLNPRLFWRNSVVTSLMAGSVELTRSETGMLGIWSGL